MCLSVFWIGVVLKYIHGNQKKILLKLTVKRIDSFLKFSNKMWHLWQFFLTAMVLKRAFTPQAMMYLNQGQQFKPKLILSRHTVFLFSHQHHPKYRGHGLSFLSGNCGSDGYYLGNTIASDAPVFLVFRFFSVTKCTLDTYYMQQCESTDKYLFLLNLENLHIGLQEFLVSFL